MGRRKKKPTLHDSKVKQDANKLKRAGWSVRASIPGFEQPSQIGKDKRIPDIEATKRGATRLMEIETEESSKKDKAQQSTFRRSASQKNRTTFKVVVTKKKGSKKKRR